MNSSTPQGPGSVSGAPRLPDGFTDTFTSRYIDTGDLRLHAVVGGDGPPLLLIHGWPGSWYYWRLVMPALARDFEVVAVDQRGIGLSDKPEEGYDTGTLANDLVGLMDALGHGQFAVVGVDTGLLIGYALAADHPGRVARLAVGEAPLPGITPPTPWSSRTRSLTASGTSHSISSRRRTRSSSGDARTSSSTRSSPLRPGRTNCRTTPSATTSTGSPRAPRRCMAASSSTARSASRPRRTSSERPAGYRCPSWRWAERRAAAPWLRTP
jgi:pimeloyl-ACP methyl ester carboxylesterase